MNDTTQNKVRRHNQRLVYKMLLDYHLKYDRTPLLIEISAFTGLSITTVRRRLDDLERQGYIQKADRWVRPIEFAESKGRDNNAIV